MSFYRQTLFGFATALLLFWTAGVSCVTAAPWSSFLQKRGPSPYEAEQALRDKDYEHATKLYERLLDERGYPTDSRAELQYGLGLAQHHLQDFDASIRSFSDSLHSEDTGLRQRAHRALSHSLYEQGAKGISRQPQITMKRWQDALSHIDAALKLNPEDSELQANREHVLKSIQQLRQVLAAMEQQQKGNKGNKGNQGQKGPKGQKGQGGQMGEGQEGNEGESEGNGSGEPEEVEKTGEKKGDDKGIGGKDVQNLPQGNLQAATEGKEGKGGKKEADLLKEEKDGKGKDGKKALQEGGNASSDKKSSLVGAGDSRGDDKQDKVNPKTGYSESQASNLIEHYMDRRQVRQGNYTNEFRRLKPVEKDW